MLTPDTITIGSKKKLPWECQKCKSKWVASLNNRISHGSGCPYCAGKISSRESCLATKNPELAKEWHPTKNGELTSSNINVHSGLKVWWKCQSNSKHEWEAVVNDRSNGSGCPCCSGDKACKENCLATKSPELAKEWHPTKNGNLTPNNVTNGSGKKVWWKCRKNKNHEWEAEIQNRSKRSGTGCPYCTNKKVCHENCLATKRPDIAKEWHPTKNGKLTPFGVTCGSSKIILWKCKDRHEWEATVKSRSRGSGCPQCWRIRRRRK